MDAPALRKTRNLVSISHFAAKRTLETIERTQHPSDKWKPEARRRGWAGDLPRLVQGQPRTCVCAQLCRAHRRPAVGIQSPIPERRGRGPGPCPYPPGSLVGSGLGTQDDGGQEEEGAGKGSGVGMQAHRAPRPWRGGRGPACHPDTEPCQLSLWLPPRAFHILFRWLCGVRGARLSGRLRAQQQRDLVPCGTCSFLFSLGLARHRGRGEGGAQRLSHARVAPPPPASPGALSPELPPLGSRRRPFMEGRTPCTPARKPRGGGSQRGGGLGGRVSEKRRWGAPGRPRGGRLPASPCPPSRPQPEHVSPRAPGPPMASAPPTGESKVLSARPAAQAPLQGLQPPHPAVHGDAEPRLGDAAEVTGL